MSLKQITTNQALCGCQAMAKWFIQVISVILSTHPGGGCLCHPILQTRIVRPGGVKRWHKATKLGRIRAGTRIQSNWSPDGTTRPQDESLGEPR